MLRNTKYGGFVLISTKPPHLNSQLFFSKTKVIIARDSRKQS